MKRRPLRLFSALGISAVLVSALPQAAAAETSPPAAAAPSSITEPALATTEVDPVFLNVELTQEDIDRAQARVRSDKAPKDPVQPERRSAALTKSDERSGGPVMSLGEAHQEAARTVETAHQNPLDLQATASTNGADASEKLLAEMADAGTTGLNGSTMGIPVGTEPPALLAQLCYGTTETKFTAIFDRWTSCARVPMRVDYYKTEAGSPREHLGYTTATMDVFTQNYSNSRSTRVFGKVRKDSVAYEWGVWDNIWTAPGVELSLIGQCSGNPTGCAATRGPVTLTWQNWNSIDTWYYWNVNSLKSEGLGRDKISSHGVHIEYYTDDDTYDTENPGSSGVRQVRCDSATYFASSRPEACVFMETIPRLYYSMADDSPHRGVADHIYDAQNYPDNTWPLGEDKSIPGKYIMGDFSAPALHRLHEDFQLGTMQDNTAHKDGACYKTGKYADLYAETGLPEPPDTSVDDCDEYPFRSTLEGAANSTWGFSVRAVNRSQNRSAGAEVPKYFRNHRILAWDASLPSPEINNDKFYVSIIDF